MKKIMLLFLIITLNFMVGQAFAQTNKKAALGKTLIESKCFICHTIGKGKLIGPDLKGVTQRRKVEWIKKMIKNPDQMLKTDPIAQQLLKEYDNVPMINLSLTDPEINSVVEYLKTQN